MLFLAALTGAALCVLTPADFSQAGVHVDAKPQINVQDDAQSAYCTYAGRSGATGGVELDVFSPAGTDAGEAEQTLQTVIRETTPPTKYVPQGIPGADESLVALQIAAPHPYAANVVRRGDTVFAISVPAGPNASRQLMQLSRIVLSRLK